MPPPHIDPDRPDMLLTVDGQPVSSTPRMRDAMLQLRANALREHIQQIAAQDGIVRIQLPGDESVREQAAQFAQLTALRHPALTATVEDGRQRITLRVSGSGTRHFVRTVFSIDL